MKQTMHDIETDIGGGRGRNSIQQNVSCIKKTGLKDSCLKSMRKELQQILLLQVSGLVLQTWKTAALHSFLFSVLLISSKRVLSLFDANFFKLSVVFSVGVSSSALASIFLPLHSSFYIPSTLIIWPKHLSCSFF